MNICVGIVGEAPGWKSILRQEGIPHKEAGTAFSPEEFSVLVVSTPLSDQSIGRLREYLAGDGAIFCSGAAYRELTGLATSRAYVSYLLPEKNSQYTAAGLVDCGTECEIPAGATAMTTDRGTPAVLDTQYEGGHVIVVPFDCARLAGDLRVAKKSFYASRARLPFERVAAVNRGGVRRLAAKAIERLHHRRALAYAHVWYYPDGERSAFNFRIDTDGAAEEEIQSLYDVVARHGIPATWFIHVRAQEPFLGVFREMRGQECALHCYDHAVFEDVERDAANIGRGLEALRNAGIAVAGFAAPYGMWNENLAAAIGRYGFEYSSEFAYDYDNLPSWPIIESRAEPTLQIPIHPVSTGTLRRQSFTSAEMHAYWAQVINDKLAVRDPLFFYHHPKNGHHEALDKIFQTVRGEGIRPVTMKEFAEWWKRRCGVMPELKLHNSRLTTDVSPAGPDVRLRITRGDGSEAFTPFHESIDMNTLQWTKIPAPAPLHPDLERTRRFNPWIPLNAVEDRLSAILRGRHT